MKKLSALVLAVLLLSGCAAAPAETTAGTEPAPSVTTAPTTEPATEPTMVPTTAPTEPAVPYDTFFSQEIVRPVEEQDGRLFFGNVRIYGPSDDLSYIRVDDFSLEVYPLDPELLGQVVLLDAKNNLVRALSDEKMSIVKPATAEYCVALSEDLRILWKLPYAENTQPEVLYTDAFSRISHPYFFENCLFFMASVDENTDGIYRLYMPEGRLDLLVKDLPPLTGDVVVDFDVVSNVAVAWEIYYEITEAQMEEYWEASGLFYQATPHEFCQEATQNPDIQVADLKVSYREWMHRYQGALDGLLYRDQGKYSIFRYYEDFLTGETREAYGYPTWSLYPRVYYPDGSMRTSDEDMNYRLWWLDSYYQKK